MLAIVLQAFAVQTHFHGYGASSLAGYERSDGEATPDAALASAADQQIACAVCEALAASSRSALPAASGLNGEREGAAEQTAFAIAQAPRFPAHAWQSRAPPVVL